MRLIGGLLTVAAFFLYGVSRAGEVKAELRTVEALLTFLRELSRRVYWHRMPLKDLFSDYRDPTLEKSGFLPALREASGKNYPEAWEKALSLLPLPKTAESALRLFGRSLGRVPLDTQKEQLAGCISALEDARAGAAASAQQKQKSSVALWTLTGLLLALLLL